MTQAVLDGTLAKLAAAFAGEHIVWGVGGSRLLAAHGLTDEARDLDLLVTTDTAVRAASVLQSLGTGGPGTTRASFCSRYFAQYCIDGVEVDLIAGYRISHEAGVYEQCFASSSLMGHLKLGTVDIPLCALEDWYVTYQLYPAKREKAERIEAYFAEKGIARPDLLRQALQGELPEQVRVRIERLLVQLS